MRQGMYAHSSNRGQKRPIDVPSHADVMRLVRVCSRRAPTGIRDAALIVLMYRCGLRVSEALGLMPRDLNLDTGELHVRPEIAKGGRERKLGVGEDVCAFVARWLDVREKLNPSRATPLFCTLKGTPMKRQRVNEMLKRRAARAGFDADRRMHPHCLRHAFAMRLIENRETLPTVSEALGHSAPSVTDAYIRHIGAPEVVEMMRNQAWKIQL